MSRRADQGTLSRRALLAGAGAAGLTAVSAGCVRRARSIVSRDQPDQVSLSVSCVPAEEDPVPVEIVSHFRDHLETAGIDVSVNYRSYEEYRLDVLLNHDFDVAVGRLSLFPDPDGLYDLFHSTLGAERGRQNPYGFSMVELDEHLEAQRTETESGRQEHVDQVLGILGREQPIAPLVFPVEHRLARTDRYEGFESREFAGAMDVLALEPGSRRDRLVFTVGFTATTKNLNPLSVEHRNEEVATGLVYDPLVRRADGEYVPWLAESIEWSERGAVVTLRDATFHDGEPVQSEDVAFTYRLLSNTQLDDAVSTSPAPMYRGETTLVDDVVARDDKTVEFEFTAEEHVARRGLTVPVLPEHEWSDRTATADVAGIDGGAAVTEAVVTENIPPVGSGPYRFEERSERDYVDLALVEDHFSTRAGSLSAFDPPAELIRIAVAPSDAGAIEGVQDGEFDFTLSPIPPEDVPAELVDGTTAVQTRSRDPYHVGYNTRREPLNNAAFRRVVSALLDRAWIAAEVFDGQAEPTATPLRDTEWVPDGLAWAGSDPHVPFLGDDGTLDEAAVREAFTEIGYQYDENRLLRP